MSLAARGLYFGYGKHEILRGVSLCVNPGQLVSLLGPNGAGKTTLFRCLLGLANGYSGSVEADGQDIRKLTRRDIARRVAYVPQSYAPAFRYTALETVLMGASCALSPLAQPGLVQTEASYRAMEQAGVAHLAHRAVTQLSGGERQLVWIARALAQQARTLILDEPTASLDYGNQIKTLACLRALADDGYAVLLATHHPDQAYSVSDELLAMSNGQIIARGAPGDVLTPATMRTLYGVSVRVEYIGQACVCVPDILL